jgi:hypothetical protein
VVDDDRDRRAAAGLHRHAAGDPARASVLT